MLYILVSLLSISAFSFWGVSTLSYTLFLWEKQKIEALTKDIIPYSGRQDELAKHSFSTNKHNHEMKNSKHNFEKSLERTLVIIKKQDYKGWFEKSISMVKKVMQNLGYYTKKSINYVLKLNKIEKSKTFKYIKKADILGDDLDFTDNFPKLQPNHTSEPAIKAQAIKEQTFQKIKPKAPSQEFVNDAETDFAKQPENETIVAKTTTSNATLNMVANTTKETTKELTVFEKIENSILQKLQETGLNHYEIWLELANHYQKYNEKEKAKEIYAMVMKHAQGKDKEMAMNGLIAIS